LIRLNQVVPPRQAGLFSAVTTAFIVQIIPELQPVPADLTNALLLRILQQNTSFVGVDPLAPISNVPTSAVQAQSILLASLSVTLFVAFVAVLGKQWISYYTRATTWGNIVDRGKQRQAKFVGLQKWRLHLIMEVLPVMLQLALLLFGAAVVVYFWDLNTPVAQVVLVVTSIGLIFYTCIAALATIYNNCPFQTPVSILLQHVPLWRKELTAAARVWLRRSVTSLRPKVEFIMEYSFLEGPIKRMFGILTSGANVLCHADEDTPNNIHPTTLSDPIFWRSDPLFTPSAPEDITASAGFWLLENSTGSLAASTVAAVFTELQWPSYHRSATALIRLRDVYEECVQAPEFTESIRLKALQSAAAYYVLYHTQLIYNASNCLESEVGKLPPTLPRDLLLHSHSDKWDRDDTFEYLLHIENRSEPLTSGRFLAYIAPYWFCGDTDSTVRFRPTRLQALNELVKVLEESQALSPTTLTNCILCVGAAMDFPLHPEDLIRVDKRYVPPHYTLIPTLIEDSDYFAPTFKMVVEHIHGLILARGRRRRHTKTAMEILLTLDGKATLPLVDATWIKGLLESASRGNMGDDTFALFLKLSARRKEEDATEDSEIPSRQDCVLVQEDETDPLFPGGTMSPETTPEYALFAMILKSVLACSEKGDWQDGVVYGGLLAMRDIPRLGSFLPDSGTLEMLFNAMEKNQPFRIRKAAYDVVAVARDGWLKSPELRQDLDRLDFPRQLHSVAVETGLPQHQCSFLMMMEILSDDGHWHPYLREAMEIWLPLRHEGPDQVLRILSRVADLPPPDYGRTNPPPLDELLRKLVEDEWAGIPGRPVDSLTAGRLQPLAEVTTQFKSLLFTETDRKKVIAVVERVIPFLERQRGRHEGPGEDVRGVVIALLEILRTPIHSKSHGSAMG